MADGSLMPSNQDGSDEKLVQVFRNLPVPDHVQSNLDRARALDGPFEPRASGNNWEELIRIAIADGTAVANTTTETILVPNVTLPALYLKQERALRATVRGRYGTTGTPTITVALRIGGVGGVVVCTSAAYTLPSSVTTVPFKIELDAVVRTGGAAGTVFGMGNMAFSSAAPNTLAPQFIPASAPAVSAAIDMTAAQDFSITVDWSAASASNTITAHQYELESLN